MWGMNEQGRDGVVVTGSAAAHDIAHRHGHDLLVQKRQFVRCCQCWATVINTTQSVQRQKDKEKNELK